MLLKQSLNAPTIQGSKKPFAWLVKSLLVLALAGLLVLGAGCGWQNFRQVSPPVDLFSGQVADLGRDEWKQVVKVGCRAGGDTGDRRDCEEEGLELLDKDSAPARIIAVMCDEFSAYQGIAACYHQAVQAAKHDALRRFYSECNDVFAQAKERVRCLREGFKAF